MVARYFLAEIHCTLMKLWVTLNAKEEWRMLRLIYTASLELLYRYTLGHVSYNGFSQSVLLRIFRVFWTIMWKVKLKRNAIIILTMYKVS